MHTHTHAHTQSILHKIQTPSKQIIIGPDQNVDYLKIDSYQPLSDLLNIYLNANIIPTITKPTRITHTSATLLDNIHVRHTTTLVHSGILNSDISDHLPIFILIGKRKPAKKKNSPYKSIQLIKYGLGQINWSYLHQYDIENVYSKFSEHLNCVILSTAPEKTVIIKAKCIIRNE